MSATPAARTFHILLLEDNAADVYLLRQSLQSAGLNVEWTVIEDGAEGLAFARRQGKHAAGPIPDLAVLDLNLPKSGGVAVLEAMRKNQDLARVRVAIMSSLAGPAELAKARELGVVRFIAKPPDLEGFLNIGLELRDVLLANQAGDAPYS